MENPSTTTLPEEKAGMIPEKFIDPETGEIRLDALVNSYKELERRLSTALPAPDSPENMERIRKALGVPETAEQYELNIDNGLLEPDVEVNKRLHDKAFTAEQAQLVYDLAGEFLVPMVAKIAAEYEADREVEKLINEFGGAEQWQAISRQLLAFGRQNLPDHVFKSLTQSYDGVMALFRMMKSDDPSLDKSAMNAVSSNEKDLQSMMKDPKYWRDRDPSFIEKVTKGFEAIYGNTEASA